MTKLRVYERSRGVETDPKVTFYNSRDSASLAGLPLCHDTLSRVRNKVSLPRWLSQSGASMVAVKVSPVLWIT